MNPANKRAQLGKRGEDLAEKYLSDGGMKILVRNYRAGHGEIDIIAKDGNSLVFVEVKSSMSYAFGPPETWVDRRKQQNMIRVAEAWLEENQIKDVDCRFDVVAIHFAKHPPYINHIKDAFWIEE
ncbi:MAG: YraN family protein [Actinobacteria bacterium]|nr:YraN family protein [Actinomycetota bacterium]